MPLEEMRRLQEQAWKRAFESTRVEVESSRAAIKRSWDTLRDTNKMVKD